MLVEDIFSKMDSVIRDYNRTHDFSGTSNHVFFVTPYIHKQIEEYYDMDMRDIRCIQYRGYPLYKWKGMNDEDVLFAEVHHAINTGCIFDESSMWKYLKKELEQYGKDVCEAAEKHFFGKGKGVRKKMAIDYRKEWEKLYNKYGGNSIRIAGSLHRLCEVMNRQINETINEREKLMEEYVKRMITTNISDTNERQHEVQIYINGFPRVSYFVDRPEFNAWCKKKRKEVK